MNFLSRSISSSVTKSMVPSSRIVRSPISLSSSSLSTRSGPSKRHFSEFFRQPPPPSPAENSIPSPTVTGVFVVINTLLTVGLGYSLYDSQVLMPPEKLKAIGYEVRRQWILDYDEAMRDMAAAEEQAKYEDSLKGLTRGVDCSICYDGCGSLGK